MSHPITAPRVEFNREGDRTLKILLLEDSVPDAGLIEARLEDAGLRFTLRRVDTGAAFLEALVRSQLDIILSDYNVPGFGGAEALAAARLACPEVPFVFVTGALGEEKAIDLLKQGARDYVLKDRLERLVPSVERALAEALERRERTRAQEALRESERALNRLLGNMPGMAFRSLPIEPWVFDYASPGAFELTGYQPEDFYEGGCITWAGIIHPDDLGRVTREAAQAFAERRQLTLTYRIRTKAGQERWVWDRSVGVHREDGSLRNIEGFVTDITQQKEAEAAAATRAEFEKQLLGIVSHDLRNPLQTIMLSAAIALRREKTDEQTRWALERIRSSGERASRLIRDLLDFTQARLGEGIPLLPRPVELRTLVKQVVEEMQIASPGREIRVEHAGDPRGEWDPDRLAQAVTNLLVNAVRYSAPETPITVRTHSADDSHGLVTLEVHNLGEPIPDGLRDRLFQPMQRGFSAPDRDRSVGLGLYIVDQVVRGHHGSVDLQSSREEGTTFRIQLPRSIPGDSTSPDLPKD